MSTNIQFGTVSAPDGTKQFLWQHIVQQQMPPKDLMRILKKIFPQEWQEVNIEIERANGNIIIP